MPSSTSNTSQPAAGRCTIRDGNYLGDQPYEKPRRTYKALELGVDRAWDGKWSMNAAYTLAFNKGNAEGPVNTDTDFGDTGRTENFDDPWVNYGGYRLPAERSPAPVQVARLVWLQ